ncbi:MAG: hypothetical protein SGPRY_004806, partial [Prymnesium sp.]
MSVRAQPLDFDLQSDYERWKKAVAYDGAACDSELILLLGSAGSGKSYFWAKATEGHATEVIGTEEAAKGIHWRSFVSLDGDSMRGVHASFCELQRELSSRCPDAHERESSHETATQSDLEKWRSESKELHEAMKPVTARFKQSIVRRGVQERAPKGRNFAVPLTFSTPDADELLKLFRDSQYHVCAILVLVAPFDVVIQRVTRRAENKSPLQEMPRQ